MEIDVPSVYREKPKIKKKRGTERKKIGTKQDSKTRSLKESVMDVGLGLVIATGLNYTILPLFVTGIANKDILTMAYIGIIYTCFALVRRFSMRRFFEIRR